MARWVKLWDGAFTHRLAQPHRPRTQWEAWLDIFANLAQWQPYGHLTGQGMITLDRGEFVASRGHLARRWKWGEQAVRTFLTVLEREGMISTQRPTRAGTVYVVVNYDQYQGDTTEANPPKSQQRTRREPAENPRIRTIEGKEGKERKNKATTFVESADSTGTSVAKLNGKSVALAEVVTQLAVIKQAEEFQALAEAQLAIDKAADVVVRLAFTYWAHMCKHPNARLDPKRAGTIRRRFLESRDPNEILFVVDGTVKDDHLMGRTGDSKYDGIETIYRDRAQVERLSVAGGYQPGVIHRAAKKYLGLGGGGGDGTVAAVR